MSIRNEGFERLKRIIASKEEEEEEPPDEARRKVDDCLFSKNAYNEIFYKTLLGMRGELMDYLDSNPEDDDLTATIRSAIVGVTRAEEVYEMMVEMNRVGFEDSDCEDQEEIPSACVVSKTLEANEESIGVEKPLFTIFTGNEEANDQALKPRTDEIIDDVNLAIHGAMKLREYVEELRSDDNTLNGGCTKSDPKDDGTAEEPEHNVDVVPDREVSTPGMPISGAAEEASPCISECSGEPVIEGRIFDVGKDTRPMESIDATELEELPKAELHRDHDFSVEKAHTYPDNETLVNPKPLPKTVEVHESVPIKPEKDPGTSWDLTQDTEEKMNSNLSIPQVVKGTKFHNSDNPNISGGESPREDDSTFKDTSGKSREFSSDVSTLPKADVSHESIPLNSGKDPGEPLKPFRNSGKDGEPNRQLTLEIVKSQGTAESAPTGHPIDTKEAPANTLNSPKTNVTYESIPINPGKDPGVNGYITFGNLTVGCLDKREGDLKTRMFGIKSGGELLATNKQLKPGWDPPSNEN